LLCFEHLAVLGSALGILGGPWDVLERSFGTLEWHSEALGAPWGPLERPLEVPVSPFGVLGGALGSSLRSQGGPSEVIGVPYREKHCKTRGIEGSLGSSSRKTL